MDPQHKRAIAPEEVAMLLGLKDIEIYMLNKQVAELVKQLEALKPKEA